MSRVVFVFVWSGVLAHASMQFMEYCNSPIRDTPVPHGLNLTSLLRVARHGARTPVAWLPNLIASPSWKCEALFSIGVNSTATTVFPLNNCGTNAHALMPFAQQLSMQGIVQHRNLGHDLRRRCPQGAATLYARAANIERTMVSAQQQCIGFGGSLCTLHTEYSYEYDALGIPTPVVCPAYASAYESFLQLPKTQSILQTANVLLVKLEALLNATSPNTRSLIAAADALIVSRCAGKTINVPDDLIEQLFQTQTQLAVLMYNNASIGQFQCGRILALALKQLKEHSCSLFVTSEPQIGCLLGAMGVFTGQTVGFAAHLELEIWNTSSIRAVYNGEILPLPCAVDSSGLCYVADFVELVSGFSVNETQWFVDCKFSKATEYPQ